MKKFSDGNNTPDTKNIIAIASGKGGVGKSTIAVNLSVSLAKKGYNVGLIDADIYGPSIPKMLGIEYEEPSINRAGNNDLIIPVEKYGMKLLSIGLFLSQNNAVVWRGPMASNFLRQIIFNTAWGKLDYLIFDLPPGTSDIHLTLVQSLPVTGVVIVSTPQDVALADAEKGILMFTGEKINVPVIGIIENMSWFVPDESADNKYYIFGKDGCKKLASQYNVSVLAQIPILQSIREGGDSGIPPVVSNNEIKYIFQKLAEVIVDKIEFRNKNIEPSKVVEIKH